jgi:putative nucleotidyltransferase with HDIG domain
MKRSEFNNIKLFFKEYTEKFHSDDFHFQRNIELKRNHSYRVWKNIKDLAKNNKLSDNDQLIAETAGILHDIGRFEQFRLYKTFYDKESENHATLGVKVINKFNILKEIPEDEKTTILKAIENHNKKGIPQNEPEKDTLFIKLLRDADKLDIWYVVTEYYCQKDKKTNNTLQLDLPDKPEINPKNIEDLLNENMVDLHNLKTLNDFKLLQLGWIYDLNFKRSYEILKEKEYLSKIFDALPDIESIKTIKNKIHSFLDNKTKSC